MITIKYDPILGDVRVDDSAVATAATSADRIQTGLDVISSENSAVAAAASASGMDNAETNRVSDENIRISNEIIRQAQEVDRVNAEGLRVPAETNRQNQEGIRQTNETGRVNAENIRSTTYDKKPSLFAFYGANISAYIETTIPGASFIPQLGIVPQIVQVFCAGVLKPVSVRYSQNGSLLDVKITSTVDLRGADIIVLASNIVLDNLLNDGNTISRYTPLAINGAVRDTSGHETIYWDRMVGNSTLSPEQNSGSIVQYAVYVITATQTDFFYAGCKVGDTFACATVKTCDANNRVQRYVGNHITQPSSTYAPINSNFTVARATSMKTAPISLLVQPEMIYAVLKQTAWNSQAILIDGANDSSGMLRQSGVSPTVVAYAGKYSDNDSDFAIGSYCIVRMRFDAASSKLQINTSAPVWGNFGAFNMGGIVLGARGNLSAFHSGFELVDLIARKVNDVATKENAIYNALVDAYSGILSSAIKSSIVNPQVFNRVQVEPGSGVHSSGYTYTAFSSGVVFQGREIHVCRSANGHRVPSSTNNNIIFYTRNIDGSFTSKILNITYDKDYRDPNLSVTADGTGLILTLEGTSYDSLTYSTSLYILDSNLNILYTYNGIISGYFGWGNCIQTPSGYLLKCAYALTSNRGVYLFRSSGTALGLIGTFANIATIFPPSTAAPSECTIAKWGSKLVAITRCDNGSSLYSETTNLEGDSGWTTPVTIANLTNGAAINMNAPCLESYVDAANPLILTCSGWNESSMRDPQIIATRDGVKWTKYKRIISEVSLGGGYNSFVKISNNLYGMMWYEDMNSPTLTQTALWYNRIDINNYLPEIV